MKKETALCLILEESICSTTDLPENTKAAGDISMPLSICTAEKAVLYFGDSEHLLQGLAGPQQQAEPMRNHGQSRAHLIVQSPPASESPPAWRGDGELSQDQTSARTAEM